MLFKFTFKVLSLASLVVAVEALSIISHLEKDSETAITIRAEDFKLDSRSGWITAAVRRQEFAEEECRSLSGEEPSHLPRRCSGSDGEAAEPVEGGDDMAILGSDALNKIASLVPDSVKDFLRNAIRYYTTTSNGFEPPDDFPWPASSSVDSPSSLPAPLSNPSVVATPVSEVAPTPVPAAAPDTPKTGGGVGSGHAVPKRVLVE
ncbi:hypothetical protein MMC20_004293 [Loxospora ochrophaea]|nr:hypothetical protein [Loxospora ochrophaea]